MGDDTYWQAGTDEEREYKLNEADQLRGNVGDGEKGQLAVEEARVLGRASRGNTVRHQENVQLIAPGQAQSHKIARF